MTVFYNYKQEMNNKNEINSYPIYTQISLVEHITILNKLHCDYKAQFTPTYSYELGIY